jgi:hypothetical protein
MQPGTLNFKWGDKWQIGAVEHCSSGCGSQANG